MGEMIQRWMLVKADCCDLKDHDCTDNCMCSCHLRKDADGDLVFVTDYERLMAAVQDPAKVHTNILRGTIALTKAQAIHIAGLPADVAEQLAAMQKRVRVLEEALRKIERWEMPSNVFVDGIEMSWGVAYGSNGEREVIRQLARAALSPAGTGPVLSFHSGQPIDPNAPTCTVCGAAITNKDGVPVCLSCGTPAGTEKEER